MLKSASAVIKAGKPGERKREKTRSNFKGDEPRSLCLDATSEGAPGCVKATGDSYFKETTGGKHGLHPGERTTFMQIVSKKRIVALEEDHRGRLHLILICFITRPHIEEYFLKLNRNHYAQLPSLLPCKHVSCYPS